MKIRYPISTETLAISLCSCFVVKIESISSSPSLLLHFPVVIVLQSSPKMRQRLRRSTFSVIIQLKFLFFLAASCSLQLPLPFPLGPCEHNLFLICGSIVCFRTNPSIIKLV